MTDLGRVDRALSGLAGEVEQDTSAIKKHWPKGHTGHVAAADVARVGGALEECHQVFARAGRDLGELHEVLVGSRRAVDDLKDARRVLFEPENILQSLAFGATRFRAEPVERSPYTNWPDYSLYYDADHQSESRYALAAIVTGQGERLGRGGRVPTNR